MSNPRSIRRRPPRKAKSNLAEHAHDSGNRPGGVACRRPQRPIHARTLFRPIPIMDIVIDWARCGRPPRQISRPGIPL